MNNNPLKTEADVAAVEEHRKKIWGKEYPTTFWPRLMSLVRLGLQKEKESEESKNVKATN